MTRPVCEFCCRSPCSAACPLQIALDLAERLSRAASLGVKIVIDATEPPGQIQFFAPDGRLLEIITGVPQGTPHG
jgi:hypothetical protein